jgi:hypothetical protein
MGDAGCEDIVEGVCNRSGVCSVGVVFHRKKEARVPGDLALGNGFSTVGYKEPYSLGGIVMGAGGANAAVISVPGFLGISRVRGVGTERDIRRGFEADEDAACSFLDDSVKTRSSWDRRGKRDRVVFGEVFGDSGGDGN